MLCSNLAHIQSGQNRSAVSQWPQLPPAKATSFLGGRELWRTHLWPCSNLPSRLCSGALQCAWLGTEWKELLVFPRPWGFSLTFHSPCSQQRLQRILPPPSQYYMCIVTWPTLRRWWEPFPHLADSWTSPFSHLDSFTTPLCIHAMEIPHDAPYSYKFIYCHASRLLIQHSVSQVTMTKLKFSCWDLSDLDVLQTNVVERRV